MSVRYSFAGFVWKALLVAILGCAFVAFGSGRAEAEEALTSWYGAEVAGNPTASGEIYEPSGLTAAHKTMPLGTELVVSYEGRSVEVTVNDRGPYVGSRDLDLSQGAAEYLGLAEAGVDYTNYEYAGYNPSTNQYDTSAERDTYDTGWVDGAQYEVGGGSYVVQPGDTLTGIAGSLDTTVEALVLANALPDPNALEVGQTLYY